MIISVNWLKKFTNIDVSISDLATLIGARLVEIEEVIDLGAKYRGVVVAKVVESAPLEGTDHLNVAKIDDGGVVEGVERDDNGFVQVVCGAPNVRAGLTVAWLPPESIVPETYGTADPFVLGAKPLRGVVSNGMLASARELDLYDDHAGILEIDKEAAPGASFAELYELDDYLLDIENKSLTHRPDAFGVIGFAREVAGIQGKAFTTPSWLGDLTSTIEHDASLAAPTVTIKDPGLSDRFQAIVLSDLNEQSHSPVLMQTYLARSGIRPINAAVDVSNYLMLLTGQPTHTYDYDKLKQVAGDDFSINVRLAHPEEKLILLDGKEITLDESDIVIAAGETAVGLAGIMGGASTKVDETTKSVVLEIATFDLYHMRSSQMRHGIFSEAVTRFTKGIPAPLGTPVAAEAVRQLAQYVGSHAASPVVEDYPGKRAPVIVEVSEQHVNGVLGTQFAAEDIVGLLENVGFSIEFHDLTARVTVPYWREDIHIPEDIIEEVGRLAGFDTINLTVPRRDFTAVRPHQFDVLRTKVRKQLVRSGANEVLTYSFVHSDLLKKAGQQPADAYRITNSLSPDLQYYRLSLTPSLLQAVHPNSKAGYDSFALFEANKVHNKHAGLNAENVPVEASQLALVLANVKGEGSAYYAAKAHLEYALLGVVDKLVYQPLGDVSPLTCMFEPKRSAQVVDSVSGKVLGVLGEYKKSVQKAFKLPEYTAGFEINLESLLDASASVTQPYRPLSKYPGTERDICFQVASEVSYARIVDAAHTALQASHLLYTLSPLDIYQGDDKTIKNVTIRIQLTSYDKTMTTDEVNGIMAEVTDAVIAATEGEVI